MKIEPNEENERKLNIKLENINYIGIISQKLREIKEFDATIEKFVIEEDTESTICNLIINLTEK